AYRNRPDLQVSEQQIAAASAGLSAARASRYPTVGASLNLQKSNSISHRDTLSTLALKEFKVNIEDTTLVPVYQVVQAPTRIESHPFSWTAAARLTLPLFDGFAAKGRIQTRSAELDIRRRELIQKRLDIALEVRQAWLAMEEARERTRVARDALAYAEQSYELNREKYRL